MTHSHRGPDLQEAHRRKGKNIKKKKIKVRKFKKATEVVILPFVSATARRKMVPRSSYFHANSDTKIDGKKRKRKERD